MTTLTLKINDNTIAGKTFLAFLKTFVAKEKAVEIVSAPVVKEKSPYNPEFVKMIKKAEKSKNRTEVKNVNDLWASL
ncbi:MAG: hypothetical protein A3K10_01060 [Bacteroidetes bacterium RIFCSPLOWO2_12_FULL_31_6]|nr:MAG: hypothetical protein A3K10_01060 [Bacteroidetes bacterium RIFCSPLOWO2_12_FULL_31_6]